MRGNWYKKGLVVGIIILFLGAGFVSAVNINVGSTNVIDDIENTSRDMMTFNPTDDASIKETNPNNNYAISYLVARNRYGGGGAGYEDDILIKFDISGLPSKIRIDSATLNLFYYEWHSTNPAGRPLTVHRITSDWDENSVTWNSRPSYTTIVTSTATVPGSTNVWMEWDVTDDVKDFVKGQEIDYGWQIMDETYWGWFDIPAPFFRQKEHGSDIGYLEIEYTKSRDKDITNQFFFELFEQFPLLNLLLQRLRI